MAIQELDFWYDGQMRRFLEQIVRAFSGFQYETGWRDGQAPQLRMVPCRLASRDRTVANIMKNNSENTLNTVPLITVDQTGLTGRREDVQHLAHVDTIQAHEREIDTVTGEYTGRPGNKYTIQRLMPRPMLMTVQVDIWTSNMKQKHQLLEQILTTFYPDIEIQNSDSAFDWTAKTRLEIDDVTFSSRTVPIGTESEIDIATITLKLPFWLSPPAKITRQRVIEQVVANITNGTISEEDGIVSGDILSRQIISPGNHRIRVERGEITLLGAHGSTFDPNGNPYRWLDLLDKYGTLSPTVSELRLKRGGDIESPLEIVGTLQADSDPSKLSWQIDPDTLPSNTLQPVTAIINPVGKGPGAGLAAAANGQRYLLINDMGPSVIWGSITASANDIIEYQNGIWSVAFDASIPDAPTHYVLNLHTGTQLRWNNGEWVLAIDGDYGPGYWRLFL